MKSQTAYTVLDAGILLATIQTEKYTQHAKALIQYLEDGGVQISAPTLLCYEIVAVTRKWVHRGLTTGENAKRALEVLLSYPIMLHYDDALLTRAYALASQYNRPTAYDAQYMAVAERLSCDFWTADERLFNAVSGSYSNIRWLGNWSMN